MSTRMAADAGDEQETKLARTGAPAMTPQRCWSSTLPHDLLIVIYTMTASPRGRARFAAVCRAWRTAAHGAPPVAALPWLLLSPHQDNGVKRLYCPEDGTVMELRLMSKRFRRLLVGGHDGGWVVSSWLGSLRITNIFSGAQVRLATVVCKSQHHGTDMVMERKVVFSEPPTSNSCILAARQVIAASRCAELVVHKAIVAERQVDVQWIDYTDDGGMSYILDLQGELVMASIHKWLPNVGPFFKVFKLIGICTGGSEARCKHKGLEVTSLCDHALFLGKRFSKQAVHVPANMPGGVERNCIYYSHHRRFGRNDVVPSDLVFLTISNGIADQMYYKVDDGKNDGARGDFKRIRSVGYFEQGSLLGGMWIIPSLDFLMLAH
ncbi:uncharacterized protein [Aegilops tauschii subsp. strangulata]|uniref:uncharacterized protein n=1 Tax=Aegilops tauschii subsp. strangulata TaxID=200361 RepID=UPI003CC86103